MIYVVNSGTIDGSCRREVMEFLAIMTKYIKKNYPDIQTEATTSISGRGNRIAWIGKFDSMAAAEAFLKKLAADKEYQELYGKMVAAEEKRGRPFWVDGLTMEYWNIEEV